MEDFDIGNEPIEIAPKRTFHSYVDDAITQEFAGRLSSLPDPDTEEFHETVCSIGINAMSAMDHAEDLQELMDVNRARRGTHLKQFTIYDFQKNFVEPYIIQRLRALWSSSRGMFNDALYRSEKPPCKPDEAPRDLPPAAAEGFGSPSTIPEDLSNEYSTPHLHFLRPKSKRKSPQKNRIVLKATVAFALAVATALTIVGIAKIAEEGPPTAKKKTDDPLQKKDKMTSETRRQLEAETRLIEKSANEPRQQAVAYEMRSRTFLSIGYHAEAIADLQSAIRLMEAGLGDDRVDATRNQLMRTEHMIGNIYKSVSGYPQAIAAYDRAIAYATAPQRHTKAHDALFIYQDRAQSKQRMNRWSDALQDCVLAIESDNGFPDAIHATLAKDVALCLRGLGREAEARQWDKITAEYEDNADSSYRQIRALLPTLKRKP